MQLYRGGAVTRDGMELRCRERELVAQLHELLLPSPAGGSSSSLAAMSVSVLCCSSPVKADAFSGIRRRSKRAREDECHLLQEEQKQCGGSSTATKATRRRRKKHDTTTMIVTTVPDIDGYQWKKYGQKQIGADKYPRSYYRCTNSMDCPAKRTVQRNHNGDDDGDSGPQEYTVVYIWEHSCTTTESASVPVILETTVRTCLAAAPDNNTAILSSSSSAISTCTQPLTSSDITWSGGIAAGEFAVDGDCWEWDPSPTGPAAAATALLQEMDFAGPIMSPVHAAAAIGSWINDLFTHESSPFVLSSCELFGL